MRGSVWNSANRGNILKPTLKSAFPANFRRGPTAIALKWGASSRWASTLYCTMRYSGQMAIGKTQPTFWLIWYDYSIHFKLIPGLVLSMTRFDFAKPFYKNLVRHKFFHLISIFQLLLHALPHRKIFATVSNKSAQRPSSAFYGSVKVIRVSKRYKKL